MYFQVGLRSHGTVGVIEFMGRDFSPDGLFVLTRDPPPTGSRFRIECDMSPVGGKIRAAVRVVRTVTAAETADHSEWGAGLEFTEISQEIRVSLAEWSAKLLQFQKDESVIEMPAPEEEETEAVGRGGSEPPAPPAEQDLSAPLPGEESDSSRAAPVNPLPISTLYDEAQEESRQPTPPERDVEVRLRLEGFEYLTRHYEVKMTAEGLFIRTEAPLPTGSRVAIELQRKGDEKIYRAKGQVMRLVTTRVPRDTRVVPGMSIRVTGCSDETREFLKEMLERAAEASF